MKRNHSTETGASGFPFPVSPTESDGPLSRLRLLGVAHNDIGGFARLSRVLEDLRPDAILLELSPYGFRFRLTHSRRLHRTLLHNLQTAASQSGLALKEALKHPRIIAVRRQISLPFEYRSSVRYLRKSAGRLFLVDYSPFSRNRLQSWSEMLSTENLANLLSFPRCDPSPERIYASAARSIIDGKDLSLGATTISDPGEEELWRAREYYMARKIRAVLYAHRPERPIYLGGWWHLTSSGSIPTLRDIFSAPLCRCYLPDRGSPPA